ncbi:hypothetical protein J6590_067844 [Homalodisca vitripennis]|nr:hypothetical protein J6590_067844 [Homalodisca vitripennis]
MSDSAEVRSSQCLYPCLHCNNNDVSDSAEVRSSQCLYPCLHCNNNDVSDSAEVRSSQCLYPCLHCNNNDVSDSAEVRSSQCLYPCLHCNNNDVSDSAEVRSSQCLYPCLHCINNDVKNEAYHRQQVLLHVPSCTEDVTREKQSALDVLDLQISTEFDPSSRVPRIPWYIIVQGKAGCDKSTLITARSKEWTVLLPTALTCGRNFKCHR